METYARALIPALPQVNEPDLRLDGLPQPMRLHAARARGLDASSPQPVVVPVRASRRTGGVGARRATSCCHVSPRTVRRRRPPQPRQHSASAWGPTEAASSQSTIVIYKRLSGGALSGCGRWGCACSCPLAARRSHRDHRAFERGRKRRPRPGYYGAGSGEDRRRTGWA